VSFQAKGSTAKSPKFALLSRAAMGLLALSAAGCATVDHPISAPNAAQAGSWRDQVSNQSVPLPGW
jgi:hypothetical protein